VQLQREADGRTRPRWPHDIVRVFEVDPDLLRGVPAEAAARLRRQVAVDLLTVAAGMGLPWLGLDGCFGLLVLDGMLVRRVTLAGRGSVELVGSGDVMRPWQDDGYYATLPAETTWRALEPTRVAVLDEGFLSLVVRYPSVVTTLMERAVSRSHVLLTRLAIAQMPRLEERLLALFWHLADRWGRVEPGRVTVPVPVSHTVLAELVCAQRPSVSVALKHLFASGQLGRLPGGGWVLFGDPVGSAALAAAPAATLH
jgi:CRP/FNR family cyclic AMP-dependent transcriptional regulator